MNKLVSFSIFVLALTSIAVAGYIPPPMRPPAPRPYIAPRPYTTPKVAPKPIVTPKPIQTVKTEPAKGPTIQTYPINQKPVTLPNYGPNSMYPLYYWMFFSPIILDDKDKEDSKK